MSLDPDQVERVRNALVQLVDRAGAERGLPGTQAVEALAALCDGFRAKEHGYRGLRDFAERHIPELRVVGHRGVDVVYGRKEWSDIVPVPRDGASPDWWRLWVSPGAKHAMLIDPTDLSLRASDGSSVTPPDGILIRPASTSIHRDTGRQFLQTDLPATVRAELEQILADPNPLWWRAWNEALRTSSLELFEKWMAYRQESLEVALDASLKQNGLSSEQAGVVLDAVRRSRPGPLMRVRKPAPRPSARSSVRPFNSDLGAIVGEVVGRMHDSELRRLELPLGLVLDALAARSQKSES